MANPSAVQATAAESTSESVDRLKRTPLERRRRLVERRSRRPGKMRFLRLFPFIGRGNVLSQFTESRRHIDRTMFR